MELCNVSLSCLRAHTHTHTGYDHKGFYYACLLTSGLSISSCHPLSLLSSIPTFKYKWFYVCPGRESPFQPSLLLTSLSSHPYRNPSPLVSMGSILLKCPKV